MSPVKPVSVPEAIRLAPLAVKAVVPPGARTISPVVELPKVKVCAFVVPRIPVPVKVAALLPEFADIEAVGVPEFMFVTANFADEEVVPPTKRSRVELPGYRVPAEEFQNDPPLEVGKMPETSVTKETAEKDGVVPP